MNLKDLIGETTEYDKKEMLEVKEPKSWLKSVSAFANGNGGKLLFGIDDNDNILGLSTYKEDSEKISEIIKNHMDSIPKFNLYFEPVNKTNSVIVLDIEKGNETPYYFKDKNNQIAYMRVGNESIPCDSLTLNTLVLSGLGKTYDSIISEYKAKDFSFNDLFNAYEINKKQTISNSDLESFDLAQGEYLTNAGVLLADNSPLRHSRIFATRWNGLDKGQDALDSIEYEHLSLIELLNKGIEFVNKHNNKGWKKQAFGRTEYIAYPERAVFEGLCNALIHRDYLEIGSEVHIDIFDDRLEIYSPGGMLEGGNIQDKDISNIKSKRRNPIIADIFGRLDYIERRGSGFKKILEDYRKYSKDVIPQFDSDKSSFVLVLRNIQYSGAQPGAEASPVPGPVPSPIASPVTVSDIIKGKVTDNDFHVIFDTISNNRKYDSQILLLCLKPRSRKELQELINIKSETYMKTNILKPLIEKGYLCLTNPDVLNDMNQKYYTHPSLIKSNHNQDL